ncbi:MAG: 16S rRNA (adenine(1518)-N(6)/adenine(1519)-N(6))-dimethyltransferase RsmA [Muribaculaceae bacterium]|nr:16S rRNA (adenine(1518)-N(6)/adenine(1519)-N(6))-dimethyltransferase RsmA [Muribaculaceae bacterium]
MKPEVRPKKALGQHFLTDLGVAARIASTLDDYVSEPVLEIGPGMGVLTQFLLERHGGRLTVAEIDPESVDYLRRNYPAFTNEGSGDRIVEGDFLQMDLNELFPGTGPFCVIGNYPYNISSQIFFKVLDYKDRVVCCSGMLQREVAERLAAQPGTKARGILSVLLQMWYDVEYLFTVDEHVFCPPPKVKSGVVRLRRNGVTDPGCDEKLFKTIVKTTFGQRRKTIRNSLRSLLPAGAVLPDSPLAGMRPEQLSVAEFIELTNIVSSLR